MVWYGRPLLAYAVYLPAAAAGLVLPYAALPAPRGAAASRSLGAALLFALLCSGLTSIGMVRPPACRASSPPASARTCTRARTAAC